MPKRKEPELNPKEQFKRFKKAARDLEIDDKAQPLDTAFQKLKVNTEKSRSSSHGKK